jgi:hypothetical protein
MGHAFSTVSGTMAMVCSYHGPPLPVRL